MEKRTLSRYGNLTNLIRPGKFFCKDCNRWKAAGCFYACQKTSKYARGYCKVCTRVRASEWRKNNPGINKMRDTRFRNSNPARTRWNGISQNAKRRGLAVMSRAEFSAWYQSQIHICVYCGLGGDVSRALFGRRLEVDRMDNTRGYEVGNVALACHRCNTVKSSHLTYEQMMTVATMFFRPKVLTSM